MRTLRFVQAEEGDEIVGLELGLEYFCDVEEDPEEAKKERKAYKAQTVDNTVAVGDGAQNGEDSASCSCIEGKRVECASVSRKQRISFQANTSSVI